MRRGLIPVCAWICRSETPSASSKSTRARRTSPAERLVVRSICSKRSRSVGCSRKASWEVNMNSHIPYIASCVTYLCNTTLGNQLTGNGVPFHAFQACPWGKFGNRRLRLARRAFPMSIHTVQQWQLRGKLQIDHHADPLVQLEESSGLLAGQSVAYDRQVLAAQLNHLFIYFKPAPHENQ